MHVPSTLPVYVSVRIRCSPFLTSCGGLLRAMHLLVACETFVLLQSSTGIESTSRSGIPERILVDDVDGNGIRPTHDFGSLHDDVATHHHSSLVVILWCVCTSIQYSPPT
jgi:hypothetical protein